MIRTAAIGSTLARRSFNSLRAPIFLGMTMFASVGNSRIFVKAPKNDPRLMMIPCAYYAGFNTWRLPATPAAGRRLIKKVPDIQWNDSTQTIRLREWLERWDLAQRAKVADELPEVPAENVKSWNHQRNAFWFMYHMQGAALSVKVGGGKSKSMIDLMQARDSKHNLVFTTPSAIDDWPGHVAKHGNKPWTVLALDEHVGTCAVKMQLIEAAMQSCEWLIVVLSYQSAITYPLGPIVNKRGEWKTPGYLFSKQWDTINADEIHKISSNGGKTANFISRLGQQARYRVGASGTIIKHKPEDLFGVFRFLDPGMFGSYQNYCDRYCIYNTEPHWKRCEDAKKFAAENGTDYIEPKKIPRFVVDYKRLDELGAIKAALTYHCDDLKLDLPVPIHQVKRCELSVRARRAYEDIAEECIAILETGETAEASNVLSKLLRMQQITSGFIGGITVDVNGDPIDDDRTVEIDDAKEKLLEETIESIGADEPVVVFCRWRHDLDVVHRVARKFDRPSFEQSGRKKQKREFLDASGARILAGQVASVSEAIDLTKCAYGVLHSIGFSLFQYEQLLGRMDRPGQTRQPTFIHHIASGSIDEIVYKALQKRADVIRYINEAGARSLRFIRPKDRVLEQPLFNGAVVGIPGEKMTAG